MAEETKELIGYARVSTEAQDYSSQVERLHEAGCKTVFAEKITGRHSRRPELTRVLRSLAAGQVLIVTRLDRLARSTRDLLNITEEIQESGAGFKSLEEPWADSTTPAGRMILTVFGGIAEFERSLISERAQRGLEIARRNGVRSGPRPKINPQKLKEVLKLINEGRSVSEVARLLNIHRSSIYRALERADRDSQPT